MVSESRNRRRRGAAEAVRADEVGSLARLLDPLYESVVRPEALEAFVRLLAMELRADLAVLVSQGLAEPVIVAGLPSGPPPPLVTPRDVRTGTKRASIVAPAARLPAGDSWTSPDLLYILGPTLVGFGPEATYLSAFRSRESGAFGAVEAAVVRKLVPHFERATRLRLHTNGLDARANPLAAAADTLPTGVVLLQGDGTVLFVNREAQRLFEARDGLEQGPTGPRAAIPSEHRELRRLIASAGVSQPPAGAGGCLAVSRPSLKAAYMVSVVPAHASGTFLGGDSGLAVLFLADPEGHRAPRPAELIEAFRLTPAQARLTVRLCRGEALAEAASGEGIAFETARVHVKAAFRKTGTCRQAELVGLLLRTCGSISSPLTAGGGAPKT